ncbi:MAG TPA: DUF418 domain-containing protein, partial [Phycisphaerales bacterium]|nr:DUF418 domain-containing protein [Phycisphaerales bacterium]
DLIRHDFDMVRGMLVSWHFNYVGSLLVSLAHASLVILACLSGRAICRALAPVGQMALTNYLFQSIVCVWVFAGFGAGLGLFNRLGRTELLLFVAGVWVLQLILSPIWLKRYHFGPAEWAWRSLTYARPQPMLRAP